MGDGRWEIGDGRWEMGDRRWEMGIGVRVTFRLPPLDKDKDWGGGKIYPTIPIT
jgi:hypothetical protein